VSPVAKVLKLKYRQNGFRVATTHLHAEKIL
jgi:hypothetical protein